MKNLVASLSAVTLLLSSGCAVGTVTAVQTAKGSFASTNPNEVEILKTRPEKPFVELGSVDASNFGITEVAKMHNALRSKAASFGANAVIITSENVYDNGWGPVKAASGVAIRYK